MPIESLFLANRRRTPMRILFVTSTRIGDAILSTGLLNCLIERHPKARITVACGTLAAQLFTRMPCLDDLIIVRKRKASLHWLTLWLLTAGRRWDLVIDLRRSGLPYLLNARARRRQPKSDEPIHRVELLARTLDLDPPPAPRLWTSDVEDREAEKLLPGAGPVLALGTTANWAGKIWPAERFAELAKRLTAPGAALSGARILIACSAGEVPLAKPLVDALPEDRVTFLTGTDLLTLYALYRRVSLFIGNDSGLMHLASAAGAPTLGLFGPTRDDFYGPWGPKGAVVRTPETYAEITAQEGFDPAGPESLMASLTVDAVEVAALELLAQVRAHAS